MTRTYQIQSADGTIRKEGGEEVLRAYHSYHRSCRVWWGDHFRVMKRRSDPQTLMLKCKNRDCERHGETLHVFSDLTTTPRSR